jgi:hypothetical protein
LVESTIRAPTGCATKSAVADWRGVLWAVISKSLIRRYLDGWQSYAVADFAAILAPDFVDHSHPD